MSPKKSISNLAKYKRNQVKNKKLQLNTTSDRWKNINQKGKYKRWRRSVFELNKRRTGVSRHYVCEKCNKKYKTSHRLHAHHIFSWNKFPKKRYTISNGVVLCIRCHNNFHRKYKYDALSNPELLLEYMGTNKYVSKYVNKNLK